MTKRFQLGRSVLTLLLGAVVVLPAMAQNRPPKQEQRQQQRQEKQQERRQERRQERKEERRDDRRDGRHEERNQYNPNRPPQANQQVTPNPNHPPERAHNQQSLDRPPNRYAPPQRNFNSLNQQERRQALENNRDFQRRTPAERQQLREGAENWNRLTQEQRNHIKNDVLPQWRQLPPDRQRAIRSRLNVLKNMPESARNQHLADPNFTRNMSEEDKAMLRDLSHLHVGGAPEAPQE